MNENLKPRIIEKPGQKLINIMKARLTADKTKKDPCPKPGTCMVCKNEKGGNCTKNEILYQLECKECIKQGNKGIYYGESSRNGASRGEEHQRDSQSTRDETIKKSIMHRHSMKVHNGEETEYKRKVLKSFQKEALGRQAGEAVLIREEQPENLINSKKEFCQTNDIVATFHKIGEDLGEPVMSWE